jgi:hypothetical protein
MCAYWKQAFGHKTIEEGCCVALPEASLAVVIPNPAALFADVGEESAFLLRAGSDHSSAGPARRWGN